jgi:hypothetical protein
LRTFEKLHRLVPMFTDLAFIDWIALIFAAVLLSAAAAAAVIAYASARARPASVVTAAPRSQTPAHAAPSRWLAQAASSSRWSSRATVVIEPKTVSRVPDPPILKPPPVPSSVVENNEVEIDLRAITATEESLALRAAKLRGRPVPETAPIAKSAVIETMEEETSSVHVSHLSMVGGDQRGSETATNGRLAGFALRSPGFFDDPVGRHELRYWDGHRWTEYVKERGERFVDPL